MSSGMFSCFLKICQINACLSAYSSKNLRLLAVLTRRSCLSANCCFNSATNVLINLL